MNRENQTQFMYLFERIGEPLYLGPRGGSNNVLYEVPVDNLSASERDAMDVVTRMFSSNASTQQNRIQIERGVRTPDLTNIGRLCPRNTIFSYFIPNHRKALNDLSAILTGEQSRNRFLAVAAVCRDDSRINCQMWLNAVAGACILRQDMRGFRLPALYEISPGSFFNPHALRQAREQAARPEQDRNVIILDRNFTGRDNNEETRLAYYREDVGINSHHWHWHLIYNAQAPRTGPGSRNRKGELFYYMHHSMVARYNAERLCNRMGRATPLALDQPLREGYFPKLTDANSGMIWGARQERTTLSNVERPVEDLRVQLNDLRVWGDRISEAIDAGVVMGQNNQRMPLTEEGGIDLLGDIIENGGTVAPNERFYGNLHNMGHVAIAFSHDPVHRHSENNGVMGDTVGAMRDPIFYRWHTYVDQIFDKYKQTLQPYTRQQLVWQAVQLNGIEVQSSGQGRQANSLYTFWGMREVDLSRGLDFTRDTARSGAVFARLTHLDHEPFQYNITLTNTTNQPVQGTVRIFMAPRNNESGQRLNFREQRLLFFEMDKFTVNLQRGRNVLTRQSSESSITIPWDQTFRDLEGLPQNAEQITGQQAVCGCGWPQHMLIPRGSSSGIAFDLFVMVTNAAEDLVQRANRTTEGQRQGCKEAVSYCGILDELYPDRKPMGFPFDRNALTPGSTRPLESLDGFIPQNSNMGTIQIQIIHDANRVELAPGGAPPGRNTVNSAGVISAGASNAVQRRPTTTTTQPGNNNQPRPTQSRPTPSRPTPSRPTPSRPTGNQRNPLPNQPQPSRTPSPTNNTWGSNGISQGRPPTFSPSPPPTWGNSGYNSPNRGWGSPGSSPPGFSFIG